jgi:hypothetical protein
MKQKISLMKIILVWSLISLSVHPLKAQNTGPADKIAQGMTDSLSYLQLTDNQKTEALGFNKTAAASLLQVAQKAKQDTSFRGKALIQQVMGIMKQRNASLQKILTPDQTTVYKQQQLEQMADLQTKAMTAQLDLTDQQVPQVYQLNLKETADMMKDMNKVQDSKGKLGKLRGAKELKSDSKDKDNALKKILSEEQYGIYEKHEEEMKAEMKAKMQEKK